MFTKSKSSDYLKVIIHYIYHDKNELLPFIPVFRDNINSFTVVDDSVCNTARLIYQNQQFDIQLSRKFVDDYQLTTDDLTWLIAHEISHFLLNHLTVDIPDLKHYGAEFLNFCEDMQVNAMLFNINQRKKIRLFFMVNGIHYREFLKSEDLNMLGFLLSMPYKSRSRVEKDFTRISSIPPEKLEKLTALWFDTYSPKGLLLEEIARRLLEIVDLKNFQPEYVKTESQILDEVTTQEIEDLKQNLPQSLCPGESDEEGDWDGPVLSGDLSFELTLNAAEENQWKKRINCLKYSIQRVFAPQSTFTTIREDEMFFKSLIPHYSRRETVMLSLGVNPVFYPNHYQVRSQSREFAAVYIDFSGSTDQYKNMIYLLLLNLRDTFTGPYFLFSTIIQPVEWTELKAGKTLSGGTDYNIVFQHINHYKFKKALIMTDGEGDRPSAKTLADLYVLLYCQTDSPDSLLHTKRVKKVWYLS